MRGHWSKETVTQGWEKLNFMDSTNLNEARNAKDKVTDANDRHLMDLLELFGFTVVNGRSSSDPLCDYTFMRGEARSTIDLCMTCGTWIESEYQMFFN